MCLQSAATRRVEACIAPAGGIYGVGVETDDGGGERPDDDLELGFEHETVLPDPSFSSVSGLFPASDDNDDNGGGVGFNDV